mmetsp:Transcript_21125/g.56924  ORF Transcript_21125/g.56924 Transcript_21125/m.56924 type:complete len:260 (-) Transcript_21125:729-1508(-)
MGALAGSLVSCDVGGGVGRARSRPHEEGAEIDDEAKRTGLRDKENKVKHLQPHVLRPEPVVVPGEVDELEEDGEDGDESECEEALGVLEKHGSDAEEGDQRAPVNRTEPEEEVEHLAQHKHAQQGGHLGVSDAARLGHAHAHARDDLAAPGLAEARGVHADALEEKEKSNAHRTVAQLELACAVAEAVGRHRAVDHEGDGGKEDGQGPPRRGQELPRARWQLPDIGLNWSCDSGHNASHALRGEHEVHVVQEEHDEEGY